MIKYNKQNRFDKSILKHPDFHQNLHHHQFQMEQEHPIQLQISMKPSILPSRTASASLSSYFVRVSLTSLYGCRTSMEEKRRRSQLEGIEEAQTSLFTKNTYKEIFIDPCCTTKQVIQNNKVIDEFIGVEETVTKKEFGLIWICIMKQT